MERKREAEREERREKYGLGIVSILEAKKIN